MAYISGNVSNFPSRLHGSCRTTGELGSYAIEGSAYITGQIASGIRRSISGCWEKEAKRIMYNLMRIPLFATRSNFVDAAASSLSGAFSVLIESVTAVSATDLVIKLKATGTNGYSGSAWYNTENAPYSVVQLLFANNSSMTNPTVLTTINVKTAVPVAQYDWSSYPNVYATPYFAVRSSGDGTNFASNVVTGTATLYPLQYLAYPPSVSIASVSPVGNNHSDVFVTIDNSFANLDWATFNAGSADLIYVDDNTANETVLASISAGSVAGYSDEYFLPSVPGYFFVRTYGDEVYFDSSNSIDGAAYGWS